jgi:hypothetical protein
MSAPWDQQSSLQQGQGRVSLAQGVGGGVAARARRRECDAEVLLILTSVRARNRLSLKPAIVEAALARLDRELTLDEQMFVLRAVGGRKKVNRPGWSEA